VGLYDACDLIYSIRSHQGVSKVSRNRASYSSLRGGPARNFMPQSLQQIFSLSRFIFSFVNHAFFKILINTSSPLIATEGGEETTNEITLDLRESLGSVMKHLLRTHGFRGGIHPNCTSTKRIITQRKKFDFIPCII